MHPALQISMLVLYVLDPRSTSGARYQSVTTCRRTCARIERAVSVSAISVVRSPARWSACTDLVTERVDGHSKRPRETKVSELELAALCEEQVLRLEISVEHPVVVAEGDSLRIKTVDRQSDEQGATGWVMLGSVDARGGAGT